MSRQLILAAFAAVCLAFAPSGAQTVDPDDFGAAPDLSSLDVAADAAPASRWGVGRDKLPPPPPQAACITAAAEQAALAASGCDCSCDGYAAAGQAGGTCDIACGVAWYACWAPDPTDEDVRTSVLASLDDYDPATRAALEPTMTAQLSDPQAVAGLRGGIMMSRAFDWDAARKCPD